MSWEPSFEVIAKGQASEEVQIKYLQACLKVAHDELETLKTEIQTMRLEYQIDENKFFREVDALMAARVRMMAKVSLPGVESFSIIATPPLKKSKKKSWFSRKGT